MNINYQKGIPYKVFIRLKGSIKGFNEESISRVLHPSKKITNEDVIFASYDKSGRTWVRFFIAAYINDYYKFGYDVDWSNFGRLTPGPMYKKEELMLFPGKGLVKPIFSHRKTIGRFFPNRKVVYISRNFLDILVSFYFFHKNRNWHDYEGLDINQFVMSAFELDEAISRINYFSRQLEKSREYMVMPYEELRQDTEGSFRKIIEFTPYEYDEGVFKRAIEHSSFESMQKLELKGREGVDKEKLHARSGTTNKYKEYLSEDTIAFVTDLLEKKMTGLLKEYYLPR